VTDYELTLPDHLDEDAATIKAKGWFAGATVTLDGGRSRISSSFQLSPASALSKA
jgi:hypothetical protein